VCVVRVGEIATAFDDVGPKTPLRISIDTRSHWAFDPVKRSERNQRQHSAAELCIWSLTLGLPQERLTPVLGPPDAEFVLPETGTTVNAYRLGSNYPCYVGIILGKAAWVRGNYPGIRRQAEVATRDEVDSSQ
jgi:hypothetical protein